MYSQDRGRKRDWSTMDSNDDYYKRRRNSRSPPMPNNPRNYVNAYNNNNTYNSSNNATMQRNYYYDYNRYGNRPGNSYPIMSSSNPNQVNSTTNGIPNKPPPLSPSLSTQPPIYYNGRGNKKFEEEDVAEKLDDKEEKTEEERPELPTKENLLMEIEKVDIEINNLETEIENIRKPPIKVEDDLLLLNNPTTMKSDGTQGEIPKRTLVQQIYLENREKSEISHDPFDFLSFHGEESPYAGATNFSLLPVWKQNLKIHEQLSAEIEKIVADRVKQKHENNVAEAKQYKTFKERWLQTITEDNDNRRLIAKNSRNSRNNVSWDEYIQDTEHASMVNNRVSKTLAVIPDMIPEEERDYCFESYNGLITHEECMKEYNDRRVYEKAWTEEEKRLFMQKFAETPKELHVIAKSIPTKSVADVINYYYNNKKTKEFKTLMKNLKQSRQYRKKIYDEGGSTRNSGTGTTATATNSTSINYHEPQDQWQAQIHHRAQVEHQLHENEESMGEWEASQEAESKNEVSYQEAYEARNEEDSREWNEMEKTKFISMLKMHGKNFNAISDHIKSKTPSQCKNFYNNHRRKLNLDEYLPKKSSAISTAHSNTAASTNTTGTTTTATTIGTNPTRGAGRKSKQGADADSLLTTTANSNNSNATTAQPLAPTPNSQGKKKQVVLWSRAERDLFFDSLSKYGRNWKYIAEQIKTKTKEQVIGFFLKMRTDLIGRQLCTKKKKKKNPLLSTNNILSLQENAIDLNSLADLATGNKNSKNLKQQQKEMETDQEQDALLDDLVLPNDFKRAKYPRAYRVKMYHKENENHFSVFGSEGLIRSVKLNHRPNIDLSYIPDELFESTEEEEEEQQSTEEKKQNNNSAAILQSAEENSQKKKRSGTEQSTSRAIAGTTATVNPTVTKDELLCHESFDDIMDSKFDKLHLLRDVSFQQHEIPTQQLATSMPSNITTPATANISTTSATTMPNIPTAAQSQPQYLLPSQQLLAQQPNIPSLSALPPLQPGNIHYLLPAQNGAAPPPSTLFNPSLFGLPNNGAPNGNPNSAPPIQFQFPPLQELAKMLDTVAKPPNTNNSTSVNGPPPMNKEHLNKLLNTKPPFNAPPLVQPFINMPPFANLGKGPANAVGSINDPSIPSWPFLMNQLGGLTDIQKLPPLTAYSSALGNLPPFNPSSNTTASSLTNNNASNNSGNSNTTTQTPGISNSNNNVDTILEQGKVFK